MALILYTFKLHGSDLFGFSQIKILSILHTLNRARTDSDKEKLLYLLQEAYKVTASSSYIDTIGMTKDALSEHADPYLEIDRLRINSDFNSHTLFYRQGMEAGLSKIPKETANKFAQIIDSSLQAMQTRL